MEKLYLENSLKEDLEK